MSLENLTDDQRNSIALQKLFNHPEVGLEAKRLYKKAVPDARFPDVDLDDKITARTAPLTEEIRRLEREAADRNLAQTRQENHAKIRAAGLDPQKVEEVMTGEKIHSYDTAIKYMTAQNRLAPSTPQSVTPISMPEDSKAIQANPTKWGRETAYKALEELRERRQVG